MGVKEILFRLRYRNDKIGMNTKIENLIIKFLTKEADLHELQQLEMWIINPKNESLFLEYIKTNITINRVMYKYNKKEAKAFIISSIRMDKRIHNKRLKTINYIRYAAAAIVVGILSTIFYSRGDLLDSQPLEETPITQSSTIEPGSNKAVLTLEDGSNVVLEKGNSFQKQNVISNGKQIVYDKGDGNLTNASYNFLTIPRGGEFFLKLADGTEVWLNSESQLKYPVSFIQGESRRVELIYGEAYFDVSPSSRHGGADFKVQNNGQEIKVLGTEFNVKAYKDEINIYTTLVEGKVVLTYEGLEQVLSPNEQSIINTENNSLSTRTVDVYSETSWKEGIFSFEDKSLKEIMIVLSRWYDIEIVFKNKSIENVVFNGMLGKNQNIEEILTNIKTFGIIDSYKIENKKIFLE
jgi:ferric-dicitrate binding protein FerR (iron transport regulator)